MINALFHGILRRNVKVRPAKEVNVFYGLGCFLIAIFNSEVSNCRIFCFHCPFWQELDVESSSHHFSFSVVTHGKVCFNFRPIIIIYSFSNILIQWNNSRGIVKKDHLPEILIRASQRVAIASNYQSKWLGIVFWMLLMERRLNKICINVSIIIWLNLCKLITTVPVIAFNAIKCLVFLYQSFSIYRQ